MDGHPPVRVSSAHPTQPRPTPPGTNESLHQSTKYDFRSDGLLETCQYEVVSQIDRPLYQAAEVIPLAWRSSVDPSHYYYWYTVQYRTVQYAMWPMDWAWLRGMVRGT